jgi:hypothetical protein
MNAQEVINAWGRKKYPEVYADAQFRLEIEDTDSPDTYGPYSPDMKIVVYADHRPVAYLDTDFSSLLQEILATGATHDH